MATLSDGTRIVVKIGSALLVDRTTGQLRRDWLQSLAQDVAWLKGQGKDVVLVSSGSIALGRGVLGLPPTTLALEQSQAAAAVGQIRLARAYEEAEAHSQRGLVGKGVALTGTEPAPDGQSAALLSCLGQAQVGTLSGFGGIAALTTFTRAFDYYVSIGEVA